MPKNNNLILSGEQVSAARRLRDLTQLEVASRMAAHKDRHPGEFLKARKLSNEDLSRLENSTPGQPHSAYNDDTVRLLAQALRVAPAELLRSDGPAPHRAPLAPAPPLAGPPLLPALELSYADLSYVDLPFVPFTSRSTFALACAASPEGAGLSTMRYLLPPRPVEEYRQSLIFEAQGDQMDTEISSGEYVIADPVPSTRWELLSEKIIVIGYADSLTVKWVHENELLTRNLLTLYPHCKELSPLAVRHGLIQCIYVVRESFERKSWG